MPDIENAVVPQPEWIQTGANTYTIEQMVNDSKRLAGGYAVMVDDETNPEGAAPHPLTWIVIAVADAETAAKVKAFVMSLPAKDFPKP